MIPSMRKSYAIWKPSAHLKLWRFHHHQSLNTLRPRQNGRHFADDVFKCIFLDENVWILLKISLRFVPKGPINNIPALVQIMAWRRTGDKPLSEPMMTQFNDAYMRTRPQWVKINEASFDVSLTYGEVPLIYQCMCLSHDHYGYSPAGDDYRGNLSKVKIRFQYYDRLSKYMDPKS